MKRKKDAGEYLAFLTVKYDIHPDLLFCAMLSSGETGKAKCGPLTVECRGKVDDKIYYLIKEDTQVVSQFPVTEEFLAKQRNPIRNSMESDIVQSYKPAEPEGPAYCQIGELRIGRTHVNLKAEVLEVSEPQKVSTRYGNRIQLAKALLKDETGEIKLCLWREQVDAVAAGDLVELENASVTKFRGNAQLTLGSRGNIRVLNELEAETNPLLSENTEIN